MSDQGWIPAHRTLFDREDWLKPTKRHPAGKREAWLDLCQMAQHRDYEHVGQRLERGEVLVSITRCMERWAWTKKRVRWFLDRLSCDTMIGTVRGTPHGTIYRIVNYDTYATVGNGQGHSERHGQGHSKGTARAPEQPLTMNNPPSEGAKKKTRQHRIPDDWIPTDQHRERATAESVDCAREAEKFRLYHEAKGTRMLSWDRAFTTWLIKAGEWAANGNGRREQSPPDMSHWEGVI